MACIRYILVSYAPDMYFHAYAVSLNLCFSHITFEPYINADINIFSTY